MCGGTDISRSRNRLDGDARFGSPVIIRFNYKNISRLVVFSEGSIGISAKRMTGNDVFMLCIFSGVHKFAGRTGRERVAPKRIAGRIDFHEDAFCYTRHDPASAEYIVAVRSWEHVL